MPIWISLIIWKIVLPDIVLWLRKEGYINVAENLIAKFTINSINEIKSIKTYQEYPVGKNGV